MSFRLHNDLITTNSFLKKKDSLILHSLKLSICKLCELSFSDTQNSPTLRTIKPSISGLKKCTGTLIKHINTCMHNYNGVHSDAYGIITTMVSKLYSSNIIIDLHQSMALDTRTRIYFRLCSCFLMKYFHIEQALYSSHE